MSSDVIFLLANLNAVTYEEGCKIGEKWNYSRPSNREDFQTENIIWRNLNAVTCEKCKELGSKKGKNE